MNSKWMAVAVSFGFLVCGGGAKLAYAEQDKPPASDNTKVNKRDRNKNEATADQAKNNTSDRDTMQKIRKSVMDDKALSTYAHNVKIISQGGKVTLKGPVRSEEEKRTIEQKAAEVAVDRVLHTAIVPRVPDHDRDGKLLLVLVHTLADFSHEHRLRRRPRADPALVVVRNIVRVRFVFLFERSHVWLFVAIVGNAI